MASIQVKAIRGSITKAPSLEEFKKKNFVYKGEPGEIYGVVQAKPDDMQKFPKMFEKLSYEVVLAQKEIQIQGETRPDIVEKPHHYEQRQIIDN
jgi:hypothetical protein